MRKRRPALLSQTAGGEQSLTGEPQSDDARSAADLGTFRFRVIDGGGWLGNGHPVLAHSLEVEGDALLHETFDFFERVAGGDAARKIRNISAVVTSWRPFNHDRVLHSVLWPFYLGLLADVPSVFGCMSSLGLPATVV